MTIKSLSAAVLALSLIAGSAVAQTGPNSHNNATTGSTGGGNSGNSATGSGAAASGK